MIDERRKSRRVALRTRCWCEGKSATLYVQIHDAGLGGFFVKTHTPFHPGECVNVRWLFPDSKEEHHAAMAVVWKRTAPNPPGMGLRFVDVPDRTVDILRRIVEGISGGRALAT